MSPPYHFTAPAVGCAREVEARNLLPAGNIQSTNLPSARLAVPAHHPSPKDANRARRDDNGTQFSAANAWRFASGKPCWR
eukprot:6203500-Pleurochrysis_carterae.AAC.3